MTKSCLNRPFMELRREHTYHDMQYPHSHYSVPRASTVRSHYSDSCGNANRLTMHSGTYYAPLSPISKTKAEPYKEVFPAAARGDPPFPKTNPQSGKVHSSRQPGREVYEQHSSASSASASSRSLKKIQTKLSILEDQNIVLQTRTQNLITENKVLRNQLEQEVSRTKSFEKKMTHLEEELNQERLKLAEKSEKGEAHRKTVAPLREEQTSTDIVSTFDRGIQEWAVCKACQRKLESCEKEPPTVTITKAELETLERDMQVLRDTVVTREKEWDQAMEREQNYRQQLVRLTAETITERHISNSRFEEMQNLSEELMEKETEIKTMQKEMAYLNKLIAKLDKCRRDIRENAGDGCNSEITEKDQKFIDEIVRRVSSFKVKQKAKSKNTTVDKTSKQINQCNENRSPRSNGKNQ